MCSLPIFATLLLLLAELSFETNLTTGNSNINSIVLVSRALTTSLVRAKGNDRRRENSFKT